MKISRHWGLQTIGWVAAFVLALHTMLFGLATAAPAHAALDGTLAFELCLSGGAGGPDGAPSHTQDHCAGCFTVGAALPPPPAHAQSLTYAFGAIPPFGLTILLPLPADDGRPGLPRAPPALA